MLKYSVLIVDDEVENCNLLKIYLKRYCKSIGEIYIANCAETAVASYLEHYPDILLFDIELGNNKTSFQIIESLPRIEAEIIFITSFAEYAIEAINAVNTAAYLLKPIKPLSLIVAIEKALNNIQVKSETKQSQNKSEEYSNFIAIPSNNKIEIIRPQDIVYLEADGRYTIFHLSSGNHKISSRNLGEYEKLLDKNFFFRIHHRYIVNLNMVVNINKSSGNYCELLNNKALPIAKRRQEKLHRLLKLK